ncbi:MAG TPA: low molecular weight protein-tyrosine-phosphatase [Egibacteraceae bacterium]|nr:low molecular weight protein-tyrosine-phosphatase [Egibacteraceae bacterium]
MRLLLVCLGNICRSPTAEAAVREALAQAGVTAGVEVDSAGLGDWHIGCPPDERMIAAAGAVGLRLEGKARLFQREDFDKFDLILVMDRENLAGVLALAPDAAASARVALFREFEDAADAEEVPDPYYGGEQGFARVVEIARAGARGLVRQLIDGGLDERARHRLPGR